VGGTLRKLARPWYTFHLDILTAMQARGRTRTDDLLITNQLLCQLSYASESVAVLRFRACFAGLFSGPFQPLGYA
jgi:hypothetical protein